MSQPKDLTTRYRRHLTTTRLPLHSVQTEQFDGLLDMLMHVCPQTSVIQVSLSGQLLCSSNCTTDLHISFRTHMHCSKACKAGQAYTLVSVSSNSRCHSTPPSLGWTFPCFSLAYAKYCNSHICTADRVTDTSRVQHAE